MRQLRPLADLLQGCLGPSAVAQGFTASDILVSWPEMVGARLARFTQPIKMEWKRRGAGVARDSRPEPATLIVRVESAFALELQHLAPVIIERVNAHYGWRCVGRLVLKQGPVRRPPPPAARRPALSEEERGRLVAAVQPIADEPLRAALDRLGQAVLGSRKPAGPTTKE